MTGRKTEIPEPVGWTVPEDIRPRTQDLGGLLHRDSRRWTRHYLVNDENPHGIPEVDEE